MKGDFLIEFRSNSELPLYMNVAASVRHAILSGALKPGEAIPSSRSLAELWGVHRLTIMSGLDILVAEGYLEPEERKALRVAAVLPESLLHARKVGRVAGAPNRHQWRVVRAQPMIPTLHTQIARGGIGFYSGLPDLREFPIKEFSSFMRESVKRAFVKKLSYSSPEGHHPFLVELSDYLAKMRGITNRKIIVTHGSQEGIYLIAQLLLGTRDKVAVEGMGYRPAWDAFRASGAELCYIPLRSGVIDLEVMERECRSGQIRLIYVTPLHQYPTTTTLSILDRARLYQIASQYQVPILEDDYDHEFHYDTQPFSPMAASDPSGLILYCSTFSKILYPSARLGFVAVPESIFQPLNALRRVVTRQNDCWLQDAVALWMKDGGFARHLRRMRKLYERRRDLLNEIFLDARNKGLDIDWMLPSGGMSFWLNANCNSDVLAQNVARAGVHVMSESHYRPDHQAGTFLRLGYACLNEKELQTGAATLLSEIRKLNRAGARKWS